MRQPVIDLRSDTVTRPTPGMRRAMADAEVGDDVYGEDPTVNALQEKVAALVGKPSALFVPSGTMANQLALLCHAEKGAEVILGEGTHTALFESGGMAAWSGAQPVFVGRGGLFSPQDVRAAVRPRTDYLPRSCLVVVENTHNWSGGRVFPPDQATEIASVAHEHGLAAHLDGARIWNAAVACGRGVDELCEPFDTVSVCLSKGLGAPVGSLLAGEAQFVARARRFRKMMGGGMRQAGILAAAGLYALEHHRERIVLDHRAARRLAEGIAGMPGVRLELSLVETNIVAFDLERHCADELIARARDRGVLVGSMGPTRVRAVLHLDVRESDVDSAVEILREAISSLS